MSDFGGSSDESPDTGLRGKEEKSSDANAAKKLRVRLREVEDSQIAGDAKDIDRILIVEGQTEDDVPQSQVDLQEYLSASASSVNAVYYDGGSDVIFPRISMTSDEIHEFVVGLRGIAQTLETRLKTEGA